MSTRTLDVAFWNYDRTEPLRDGRVKVPGVDVRCHGGASVTRSSTAWCATGPTTCRSSG